MARDPDRRQHFEREAQAIAALNHPNIVTIHSVDESADVLFLTMELVEGRALSDCLPTRGFDFDGFLGLAVPLVDAVDAAQQVVPSQFFMVAERVGFVHFALPPSRYALRRTGRATVDLIVSVSQPSGALRLATLAQGILRACGLP